MWPAVILFLSGCIGEVTAPRCRVAADCDLSAGYRFCHHGYCFKHPLPGDLEDAKAPYGSTETSGGESSPTTCSPDNPTSKGDGCCPAWGGRDLSQEPDCLRWRFALESLTPPRLATFAEPRADAPAVVVNTSRPAGTERVRVIYTAGLESSGELRWEKEVGPGETPLAPVLRPDGGAVVATKTHLVLIDVNDGRSRHEVELAVAVPPVLLGDLRLVAVERDGAVHLLDEDLAPSALGPSFAAGVSLTAPVAGETYGERLYVVDDAGGIHAVSIARESPRPGLTEWSLESDAAPLAGIAPALFDDYLFLVTANHDLMIVRDEEVAGVLTASFPLGGPVAGLVATSKGTVFALTNAGALVALSVRPGHYERQWSREIFAAGSALSPVWLGDQILLAANDGEMAAYRLDSTAPEPLEPLWQLTPTESFGGDILPLPGGGLTVGFRDGAVAAFEIDVGALAAGGWPAARGDTSQTAAQIGAVGD